MTSPQTNKDMIRDLVDEAFNAFWDIVVKRFPEARSGDLSPLATIQLHAAGENAVKEWIANNVAEEQ